jgi:hypothetical protein
MRQIMKIFPTDQVSFFEKTHSLQHFCEVKKRNLMFKLTWHITSDSLEEMFKDADKCTNLF